MNRSKILGVAAIALVGVAVSGCSSIRESRGYIVDSVLVASVQPGIDNQRSVEATLGRPTFSSQFGEPTWYYVSSTTGRKPFRKTRIKEHQVLAVKFDKAGNVIAADRTGMDQVVYLSPDGDFDTDAGPRADFPGRSVRQYRHRRSGRVGRFGPVIPPGIRIA